MNTLINSLVVILLVSVVILVVSKFLMRSSENFTLYTIDTINEADKTYLNYLLNGIIVKLNERMKKKYVLLSLDRLKKRPVIQRNWEDKYKCTDYMIVSIGNQFGNGNGNSKTKKIKLVPIKYHFKTCKGESLNRIEKKKLSQKDFENYISDHYELEKDKDFNVTRMYLSDNTVIYLIIVKDFNKEVKNMKSLVGLEMSNTNDNDDFQ